MRIALVGCNSLLARYLIDRLFAEPSVQMILLGRREPLSQVSVIANRTEFQLFDYPTALPDFTQLLTYDAIIYCAAAGVQVRHQASPATMAAINYELPARLLTELAGHGYRGRWLSFGSYFELGARPDSPAATEVDVVAAVGVAADDYCVSKRQLTAFMAGQAVPFAAWHLILPTIYGAYENADRLIPYLVRSLRQGELPQLSAGTQVRQYLHGRDVAELSAQLLLSEPAVPGGIYNVAGPDVLAIKNLVAQVFAHFGQDATRSLGAVKTRDEGMAVLHLDGTKLTTALPSWQPAYSLAVALPEYL